MCASVGRWSVPKLFVAILSCWQDERNGNNNAVRETWLKDMCGLNYAFILGEPSVQQVMLVEPPSDIQMYGVDDGYNALPWKTKFAVQYALNAGYDYLYKCDRDTFVLPRRLMSCGYEQRNYLGHFPLHPREGDITSGPDMAGHHVYASGGCGYFLSRKAMEIITNEPVLDWAEDRWVGDTLARAGVHGWHDRRFWFKRDIGMARDSEAISCHLSHGTGCYNKNTMYEFYNASRRRW
jgi:Galactosyltransferase